MSLPILGILSILVKTTSKGPVFYQAEMLGKNEVRFMMKKLRSMHIGSNTYIDHDDKTVVLNGDPRLTAIGAFLRIGFDEIPQLINIVAGEMSFVGPRPDPTWVLPRYTPLIKNRLKVKPGITGLSQVLDGRNNTQATIYFLDNYYVRNRSIKFDLLILALTLSYVIGWRKPSKKVLDRLLTDISEIHRYELRPVGDAQQPTCIE